MPKINLRKLVEEQIDPEARGYFDKFEANDFLLEIVAPGTRTDADFCVQVNVYRKVKYDKKGMILIEQVRGYQKVEINLIDSIGVPMFFLEIGKLVNHFIAARANTTLKPIMVEAIEGLK